MLPFKKPPKEKAVRLEKLAKITEKPVSLSTKVPPRLSRVPLNGKKAKVKKI